MIDVLESCPKCSGNVLLQDKTYRCRARNCRAKVSIFKKSFFSLSKLPCNQVILIGYFWLGGSSHSEIQRYTGHSTKTITSYINYFRQLVSESLANDDAIIGGDNVVVEIDESKFGKRKHNRGHYVEGVWVIGGVERSEERKIFAEVVQERSASTLLDVIVRHVKPGTIIHTDMWKAYSDLEAFGFVHHQVNHSINFVGDDGTHTNTIEGTWNGIKLRIAVRNRNKKDIGPCLLEFIWRRRNIKNLWSGFISSFQEISFE
jgi:transposase-like protein